MHVDCNWWSLVETASACPLKLQMYMWGWRSACIYPSFLHQKHHKISCLGCIFLSSLSYLQSDNTKCSKEGERSPFFGLIELIKERTFELNINSDRVFCFSIIKSILENAIKILQNHANSHMQVDRQRGNKEKTTKTCRCSVLRIYYLKWITGFPFLQKFILLRYQCVGPFFLC